MCFCGILFRAAVGFYGGSVSIFWWQLWCVIFTRCWSTMCSQPRRGSLEVFQLPRWFFCRLPTRQSHLMVVFWGLSYNFVFFNCNNSGIYLALLVLIYYFLAFGCPLVLCLGGVRCGLCATGFSISINWIFPSIVENLSKNHMRIRLWVCKVMCPIPDLGTYLFPLNMSFKFILEIGWLLGLDFSCSMWSYESALVFIFF